MIDFFWKLIFLKEVFILGIFFSILESQFPLAKPSARRVEKLQDFAWLYFNEHITPILFNYFKVLFSFSFIMIFSKINTNNKIYLEGSSAFIYILLYKDFMFYIAHNISHRIPFFWRLHILHHSSSRLDWLAGFRGYWLDNIFFEILMSSIFIFVQVSENFLNNFMIFELTWVYFIHCNVNFRLGFIQKWINNPRAHHWHHSIEMIKSKGQNFGAYTLIWDKIFNTLYFDENPPATYGINNKTYPKSFFSRLFYPFRSHRKNLY